MAIVDVKAEPPPHSAANDEPGAGTKPASAGDGIARTVAEIFKGRKDESGEVITFVYFKRNNYAIYRRGAPPEVVVMYSDTEAEQNKQIAAISSLLPLRDKLIHLIQDLRESAKDAYRTHIADALRLGLENQPEEKTKALLEGAIQDAIAIQARNGRMIYLLLAGIAILPALALIVIGGADVPNRKGVHLLVMAAGAGAFGAVLSIAIGIRARSVAIEGDVRSNAVDAAVRVCIGVISAAALFLLLNSGVVSSITAGSVSLTGADMQWQIALIIGFAAGFLERLVPDLLEKSAPSQAPPKPPAGTIVGGTAP